MIFAEYLRMYMLISCVHTPRVFITINILRTGTNVNRYLEKNLTKNRTKPISQEKA